MPYCPKCDMEFIDGITKCSDCGGPLVESEEVAKAMQKNEQLKRERARANGQRPQPPRAKKPQSAPRPQGTSQNGPVRAPQAAPQNAPVRVPQAAPQNATITMTAEEAAARAEALQTAARKAAQPTHLYVDKAQKYEDLKSSASAFLIVGGTMLVVSILCWIGIINLPLSGASKIIIQGALTAMGLFSMVVYVKSVKDAKELAPQIDEEKDKTKALVDWFLENFTADSIDSRIISPEELSDEEISLVRFQAIQYYLVTEKGLTDPSYIDLLCEEIYTKLFES